MNKLNIDLEILVGSYLCFEEILTIYNQNLIVRDKIIKMYHRELPSISDATVKGNLETIKYLLQKNYGALSKKKYISIVREIINFSCLLGHLSIIKYFYQMGYKPYPREINYACGYGHLELVKYLLEQGVRPTSNAIEWASRNGHFKIVQVLVENDIKPTISAIISAEMYKYPLVVEYLKSMM